MWSLVYFSTMIETAHIYELIEEYRAKLGLSQAEVAYRAFGQDSSAAIQGLRRGRSPGIERLSAMSEVLGLELYFGPPRQEFDKALDELKDLGYPGANEFSYVRRFDVKLSAGPGTDGNNARELAQVAFRQDWMLQQGLRADQCVVCNVSGDSMQPLLFAGDLVLIDRRKADLRDGQVYAMVDVEGDVRIKRLEKIKGGVLLRSDNPTSPTEARMGEEANLIEVIGRLAWSGHTYDPMKPAATK